MPAVQNPRWRVRTTFLVLGVLFELLLIGLYLLPPDWLTVNIRNCVILIHLPLFYGLEAMQLDDGWFALIMIVAGLAGMAYFWSLLFQMGWQGFGWLSGKLVGKSRLWVGTGTGVAVAGLVTWLVIQATPANPVPFAMTPEVRTVVHGENALAVDLYHQLALRPGNMVFSPYSISWSLAMAGAGARGTTEIEITNLLHTALSPGSLKDSFHPLAGRLSAVQRWNRIALTGANAVWYQADHPFLAGYLDVLQRDFAGRAYGVDFKGSPESAANMINEWVQRETSQKIKTPPVHGQITDATRLVLGSSLYFKGRWLHPFKRRDTRDGQFQVTTNLTVSVPMMWQHANFKIAHDDDRTVKLLELPYCGRDLSMVILITPPAREMMTGEALELSDLEAKLTPETLQAWLAKLDGNEPEDASVWLPRFGAEESHDLAPALKAMGMNAAFGGTADFSGMDGAQDLVISDAVHAASLTVDESGTEAAAMTLEMAKSKGMAERFQVDRPFIFLVRDNGTGAILFMGRITNPAE